MASSTIAIDIQSRISAFEALTNRPSQKSSSVSSPNLLDAPNSPTSSSLFPIVPSTSPTSIKPSSKSPSPSPPILGRKTSLIDLKDWELDDGPSFHTPYAHRMKSLPTSSGTSPTPSWGGRQNQRHVSDSRLASYTSQSTPLIHLESSPPQPKAQAPPLPPRKASYGSLKSVSNSSTSSLARSPNAPSVSLPSMPPRKKSDSLTVDAYPPGGKLGIAIPRGHAPASSISSFHSVSLSSDGGTDIGSLSSHLATFPMDRDAGAEGGHADNGRDVDNISLDSFENVSTVSPSVSSISMDWGDYVKRQPPKLPQRPKPPSLPTSPPSNTANSPHVSPPLLSKHPPPPPPLSRARPPPSNRSSLASTITSASDHSSVVSAATSRTSFSSIRPPQLTPKPGPSVPSSLQNKLTRPTPIPPAARTRYEAVFVGNILAQRRHEARVRERALSPPPGRKVRQAAGWRGLSVDLITNPEAHTPSSSSMSEPIDEEVGPEDRLDGRMVVLIWKKSRLDRTKLMDIWNECDPTGIGSLDRVAFVKGMWRIDEELRRAQLVRHNPLAAHLHQARRKPSKPILR